MELSGFRHVTRFFFDCCSKLLMFVAECFWTLKAGVDFFLAFAMELIHFHDDEPQRDNTFAVPGIW